MELINLAKKQMTDINCFNEPFFIEYFRVFNSNPTFEEETKELMQTYTQDDISTCSSFLHTNAERVLSHINAHLNMNAEIGIITFLGDCNYDGHGILIDGKPYAFFDLHAIIPRLNFYNFNAFITHEILHAIHYYINPDFYRDNLKTVEERYLKVLFSEGVATYLSHVISKEAPEDAYWFGYIDEKDVLEWIRNSEIRQTEIAATLHQAITANKTDIPLYNRLFGIEDFTQLTSFRIGYYYGSEIVREISENINLHDVLALDYNQVKRSIYNYFNLYPPVNK